MKLKLRGHFETRPYQMQFRNKVKTLFGLNFKFTNDTSVKVGSTSWIVTTNTSRHSTRCEFSDDLNTTPSTPNGKYRMVPKRSRQTNALSPEQWRNKPRFRVALDRQPSLKALDLDMCECRFTYSGQVCSERPWRWIRRVNDEIMFPCRSSLSGFST